MREVILNRQHLSNRIQHVANEFEQAVGGGHFFQMAPEAFNGIEVRAVRWQSKDHRAVFVVGQHRLGNLTMMIGSIVQDQDDGPTSRHRLHQILDEETKRERVLLLGWQVNDLIGAPVVSAKQVIPLLLAWRGNPFLLAAPHPAFNQGAKQPQGRFVHKEKFDFAGAGFFSTPPARPRLALWPFCFGDCPNHVSADDRHSPFSPTSSAGCFRAW
jgi:hypothetical protein